MERETSPRASETAADRREFWTGLARAVGGAMLFALPMLMTMEMWWLGFYMNRLRLVLLMVLDYPGLLVLSHYLGFKKTMSWTDDVADALVAYGVGFVTAALILALLGLIRPGMSADEVVGKIALQSVATSLGAMLARSQMGGGGPGAGAEKREPGYAGEIFIMVVGAVFLAFNLAPTQEMIVIAFRMRETLAIGLAAASLLVMHAFVYAVNFQGQVPNVGETSWWSLFLRFTLVGYAGALVASAYMLWTFGRLEGTGLPTAMREVVVLGFPAAIGAAGARLVIGPWARPQPEGAAS